MARQPRQVYPDHLTEITVKTFQGRFLLAPSRLVNALFLGVLAVAQKKYGMTICAVVALSNHFHLLVVPRSGCQLERFCQFLNSNLSTEIGRHRGWTGGIFRRQYKDVVVTHEESAQTARLRYFLSHGVKEGLVRRPQDWPGVHCVKALLRKRFVMNGKWVDRTAFDKARRRATAKKRRNRVGRPSLSSFTKVRGVRLSKLPCWEHMSDAEYFEEIRAMVRSIMDELEEVRGKAAKDAPVQIRCQNPEHRPETMNTSTRPKPVCHAASARERARFREQRREWVKQYRNAADQLRKGCLAALRLFPAEAFLPPIPYEIAVSAEPP